MTKTQEMDALRDLAARLGPDSYLGPWLESILPAVESSIRSDVIPFAIDPAQARADALAILKEAKEEAEKIRADAKIERCRVIERATKDAAMQRDAIIDTMRHAFAALVRC